MQHLFRTSFIFLATLILGLAPVAYSQQPPEKEVTALRQQLKEQTEQNRRLSKEVDDLKTEIRGEAVVKQRAQCPADVYTFVRSSEGSSCDSYQAQVAGWSEACARICKPAARLQEAEASATATCKAFCTSRGCSAASYKAPEKCGSTRCLAGDDCIRTCPYFDACYLEQAETRWNCWCASEQTARSKG